MLVYREAAERFVVRRGPPQHLTPERLGPNARFTGAPLDLYFLENRRELVFGAG